MISLPFITIALKDGNWIIKTIKFFTYFISAFNLLLILKGVIYSVINKDKIIHGVWNSETTTEFYSTEHIINWAELTYNRLFIFEMHPTYYALYVVTAISIIFFTKFININKIYKIILIIINSSFVLLISSKAGIISLILIYFIKAIIDFKQGVKNNRYSLLVGITIIIVLAFSIPSTRLRIDRAISSLTQKKTELKNSSTNERIKQWSSIKDFSNSELFFGIGISNAQNKLNRLTEVNKNTHNQFLQSLLSSGIIGLLLLVTFLILPLFFNKSTFLNVFVSIIVFNLMFENLLDRQWGIIFITFFYSIFIFSNLNFEKYE